MMLSMVLKRLFWGPHCCRFRFLEFKDLISLLSLFWLALKAKLTHANTAQSSKVSGTVFSQE